MTTLATTPIAALTTPVTTAVNTGATTLSTTAVSTAAVPQAPISPIATLLAVPARIADAVLGLFGITPATASTPTPISPAPIVQLLFAAFREFENFFGLTSAPANPPVLNAQTFTGSLTTPTPTVAQFLDAATAEYVLGGTPAGLTPFVVDGLPVAYSNIFTGTSAQVWVTPQNQIIIAYQGTTGGTNLLFNPLIAIPQILADAQAVLTQTTPAAFPDALRFAQWVQAEAAEQGFATDSIFVTGHSLGGWQAEYVAQNTGMGGIGFESPGLNTTVPGNGANSLFVNTSTYGDPASFSSDIPGTQPFGPAYVPGGGTYPHYGPIVLLGDPTSAYPLTNAMALWGTGIFGDLIALLVGFGSFFEYHLPSVQAYSLGVDLAPALLPGSGVYTGPVYTGFGDLTIPEFLQAASTARILIEP
jgi:alpha/beta hydrolase fold